MIKRSSLFLLVCILLFTSSFAVQEKIIEYEFEEGGGVILQDSSPNDYNSQVNGMSWSTNSQFGVYAGEFDENDDYFTMTNIVDLPEEISISFWVENTGNDDTDTYFSLRNTSNNNILLQLQYNTLAGDDTITLDYRDNSQILQSSTLQTYEQMDNEYYNYLLSINRTSGDFSFYRDNVLINTGVLNFLNTSQKFNMRVGADWNSLNEMSGYMDAFHMFNFVPNELQRFYLYQNNLLLLESPEEEQEETGLIISHTPDNNATFDFKELIEITANVDQQVDRCDLYIDNSKIKSYNDILNFQETVYFDESGEHSYQIYCQKEMEGMIYFDITNITTININEPDPTEIIFNVKLSDFQQGTERLYIHTPCLEKGISSKWLEGYEPYRAEVNPQGAWIREVSEEGIAKFNLPTGNYSFCMITGNLIVQDENKTTDYSIVSVEGFKNLGEIKIPAQEFVHYEVTLEKFDVYEKTNPKAWGQTWAGIFTSIIMLLLGVILIIVGSIRQSEGAGKIVFAGVLLVLSSFGINLNIFTGVLF